MMSQHKFGPRHELQRMRKSAAAMSPQGAGMKAFGVVHAMLLVWVQIASISARRYCHPSIATSMPDIYHRDCHGPGKLTVH
jgi:hypothetical protein